MQLDIDEEYIDVLHELILRGMDDVDITKREYGEAYDAFVDSRDVPHFIGDLPDRVQETWAEITRRNQWWDCPVCDGDTETHESGRECTECDWSVTIPRIEEYKRRESVGGE